MEGGLEDGGYHRMEAGQPEWDQPARMFIERLEPRGKGCWGGTVAERPIMGRRRK